MVGVHEGPVESSQKFDQEIYTPVQGCILSQIPVLMTPAAHFKKLGVVSPLHPEK